MPKVLVAVVSAVSLCLTASPYSVRAQKAEQQKQRNIIIFVADGLRYGSVNATDSPPCSHCVKPV
jgi:alkaline phosphatase